MVYAFSVFIIDDRTGTKETKYVMAEYPDEALHLAEHQNPGRRILNVYLDEEQRAVRAVVLARVGKAAAAAGVLISTIPL